MSVDAAPDSAEPVLQPVGRIRAFWLTRKKWIVGALAGLSFVALVGTATWLLWPSDAKKPAAEEEMEGADLDAPKPAARKASDANSASKASKPAASAVAKAEPAAEAASAATEATVAESESQHPMDQLQRRLAEKLGAQQTADGELRVMARPQSFATGAKRSEHTMPAMPHWGYDAKTGPEAWGRLHPEFATCSSGKRQSPIDIRDGIKVQLDAVQFSYKPTPFRVIDTGHTVQVNVGAGNFIEVMGRRYELQQFHFHRPSEERINGKPFDMTAHFVHRDAEGRLAVVAVLLERGSAQPLIQTVWNNLPLEKGDEVVAKATIDPNTLVPTERGYYIYMGSLTTPPCTEGVLWMVMKTPVTLSAEQIDIFSRLYPMNARPVQPASGRLIKESS
jgi:carbonic anhydrase